jgi:hypothetical protein
MAGPAESATLAEWVQIIGPGRDLSLRAITEETSCPVLTVDGETVPMRVRAEPGPLFPTDADLPQADFPVRVCEAVVSSGKAAQLEGRRLRLLPSEVRRIVVLGDTGCRIKKKKTQDCNDANAWPYAKLAAHAAQAEPDLVIHVGDYLYREKPCAARVTDCPDSPTGYGWTVWNADFFAPSAPLLAAAPWIMVRGNHETCRRAGEGWFRFLDHSQVGTTCGETSRSFVAALGAIGFVVMDSSTVADASGADAEEEDDDDEAGQAGGLDTALKENYEEIAATIPPTAWLLTHAPFKGVRLAKGTGETEVDNTIQQQALGNLLSASVAMIVSGHVHMFEALNFADGSPPQLVVGTGGDKLAKRPDVPADVAGVAVTDGMILKRFGYLVWDRADGEGLRWNGELRDENGLTLAHCQLSGRSLECVKAQ